MPKIPTPLTDTKISNAKPKDKDYTLADGKGLHLLIKSTGAKIWEFVFISPLTKKRRKKSLGSYPTVTLSGARDIRSNYIMLLQEKKDPVESLKEQEQNEKAQDSGLFENVMNEWFERQKKQIAQGTFTRKLQLFKSFVLPRFEGKHIKDIKKSELLELLEDKEKTAPETAFRLFNYLSNLWSFAILKDYCEYNYLKNINKKDIFLEKRIVNNYPKITDKETFKELINKCYNYKGNPSTKNVLRFVIHIPLRAGNLCNLKWSYIDFDNKTLTIPRELMKLKDHNLPDFKLPLTDEVINILNDQKEYLTRYASLKEYVFVGVDNVSPIHRETPRQALSRMGYNGIQTTHSFRGTYSTIADENDHKHKATKKIMESILDHQQGSKVEKAYKNKVNYLEQQKPLLEWWSNYILNLRD